MKKSLYLLLGLVLVLFLAACSGDDGTEETSTDNGAEESSDNSGSEETSGEDVTLRIAWWGEQTRHDYTLEVIEMYEEQNPNVTIEPEYASWDDYWQKLAPQAAANELPDIIAMDLSYLSQYAQNGQLADLEPFLENEIDISNISEDNVYAGQVNDGLYGFNLGVNALGFQYNPEKLAEIGYDEIPEDWTWDKFQEMSQAAADAGIYFDNGFQADVFFNYYLRTQGKRLYAEDGSGLGYEDDQLFVDFFSMVTEEVEKGATPTPDFLAQLAGPEDDPVIKGEGVGIFQWSNQFVGLEQLSGLDFEFAPMPGPNMEEGLFLKPSMFFSVAENSEAKAEAAKFISFFINDIEANKLILGDRGVPISSEVLEALKSEVSDSQAQVFDYIEWAEQNSTPMGAADPAGAGEIIELLTSLSEQMSYGETTPEEAAEYFRTQAESILGN
ncbi:multiple sugar transport system substrate-binding protein [Gracilibacillus ureilyticus]|uniref:Multiple sugar transport system substrate-binding protein n=1 Tax=Gracilibacillus ureilyticus TaxID=531814 RepID=A0A1H9S3N0_9BACI|nr:extracellular solute-binding protein [Gracilibacillus ureilyticus]SER79600.1 multiple sugar transport system substrate-binding protein [Gracilibacillus ureilyticus]